MEDRKVKGRNKRGMSERIISETVVEKLKGMDERRVKKIKVKEIGEDQLQWERGMKGNEKKRKEIISAD